MGDGVLAAGRVGDQFGVGGRAGGGCRTLVPPPRLGLEGGAHTHRIDRRSDRVDGRERAQIRVERFPSSIDLGDLRVAARDLSLQRINRSRSSAIRVARRASRAAAPMCSV